MRSTPYVALRVVKGNRDARAVKLAGGGGVLWAAGSFCGESHSQKDECSPSHRARGLMPSSYTFAQYWFSSTMLSSVLRGIHVSDKLLGSPVKWSPVCQRKVFVRTWVCFEVGQGLSRKARRESALRPGVALENARREIWTPQGSLRAGRSENSNSQVSVPKSQKGGASLSAAQKGKGWEVSATACDLVSL